MDILLSDKKIFQDLVIFPFCVAVGTRVMHRTRLKEIHPKNIPVKFDANLTKMYKRRCHFKKVLMDGETDVRTTTDDDQSPH